MVQRHTMLPFHPWALSGRPISSAHSDVPGPHRPTQPEDGTVAVDNAPRCVRSLQLVWQQRVTTAAVWMKNCVRQGGKEQKQGCRRHFSHLDLVCVNPCLLSTTFFKVFTLLYSFSYTSLQSAIFSACVIFPPRGSNKK